ncbi:hypothetical protein JYU19_00560 [bacterium AH-315-J21]|nr:hypothetical protein [bacterium AH-315-J21]
MKKSLLVVCLFAFCAVFVAVSFSSPSYAKGAKKEAAKAEKAAVKSSPSKATSATGKTSSSATTTKTTTSTTEALRRSEELYKAHGTSSAEIEALIRKYSGASATSSTPTAGEQINWQVIAGGGGSGSSTNFGLVSVIGQTAVGMGSSTNFNLNHGFLQTFASAGCCVTAGDYTNDGSFNIADVTSGIARIFSGGSAPSCQDQADFNSDNSFNIADVTAGIARIFTGGAAPVCGTTGT